MYRFTTRKNRRFEKLLGLASFALMLAFGSGIASAIILNPGDTNKPVTGTYTLAGETHLAPDDQSASGSYMMGGVAFDFTLTTKVYQNPGTGGLDFVYQLQNTSPASDGDSFERLTVSSFSGYSTDADYQANSGLINFLPGDLGPVSVDRSAVPGSVVGFQFTSLADPQNTIDPGDTTDLLIVRTNATAVIMGSASVIDGSAHNAQIQAPFGAVAVPEPTSLGLIGVAALGLLKRPRRSDAK